MVFSNVCCNGYLLLACWSPASTLHDYNGFIFPVIFTSFCSGVHKRELVRKKLFLRLWINFEMNHTSYSPFLAQTIVYSKMTLSIVCYWLETWGSPFTLVIWRFFCFFFVFFAVTLVGECVTQFIQLRDHPKFTLQWELKQNRGGIDKRYWIYFNTSSNL